MGSAIIPIPPSDKLTYDQSATLMSDVSFRNRVKVACLTFAKYITGEPSTIAAHNTRVKWAQSCMTNPDMIASQVQPPTVMEDQVQTSGAAITDEALQAAVETAVTKLL